MARPLPSKPNWPNWSAISSLRRAGPLCQLLGHRSDDSVSLRSARAFTKRDKIIKLQGNYHGHADFLLVQAGSGVATLGLPDSPGVPAGATRDTLTAPFNDLAAVEALFDEAAAHRRDHFRAGRREHWLRPAGRGATWLTAPALHPA